MTDMHRETELIVAYDKVLREARHIMALHHRMNMLLTAAVNDGDKLQKAIDTAQRIAQEIGERILQEGNTT